MAGYPKIVHTEEGMRDGLQIESADIPVAAKIRLLNALSKTGLREINVGSFVSPKYTPQMACVEELINGFTPEPGVKYTYTALNDKGVDRAKAYTPPLSPRAHELSTRVDMCDVFAQRNTNRTQAQQMATWPKTIEKALAKGVTEGGMSISNVWGSNWIGEVPFEQHMLMFDRMYQMWDDAGIKVTKIGMADATGWCMPHQVERTVAGIKERWPSIKDFNLHLHNARGAALASVYAALRVLDGNDTLRLQSSIGGMAGCPYCGNGRAAMMIATEDLMHMLQEMGIYTGVDLYKLVEAGLAGRRGRRPPALRLRVQGRSAPAPRQALRDGHAAHRNARAGEAFQSRARKPTKARTRRGQEPITSWMRPEAPGYKEKLAQPKEAPAQPKVASVQPKVAAH